MATGAMGRYVFAAFSKAFSWAKGALRSNPKPAPNGGGGGTEPPVPKTGPEASPDTPSAKPSPAAGGAPKGTFPENPGELLSDVPHTVKANGNRVIQPSETLRIRAERHALKPGETFSPRHHGQHYHVEIRVDPSKSWNNKNNVLIVKPPGYKPGGSTGFVPGEEFPGQ